MQNNSFYKKKIKESKYAYFPLFFYLFIILFIIVIIKLIVNTKFNIGIDIEDIHRFEKKKYLDINSGFSKRVLSEEEKIFLEQNCNSATISNIWTRKESYSKILGKGIAMDLRTINTLNDSQFYSYETTDSNGGKYTISIAGDDITVNRTINFYF